MLTIVCTRKERGEIRLDCDRKGLSGHFHNSGGVFPPSTFLAFSYMQIRRRRYFFSYFLRRFLFFGILSWGVMQWLCFLSVLLIAFMGTLSLFSSPLAVIGKYFSVQYLLESVGVNVILYLCIHFILFFLWLFE